MGNFARSEITYTDETMSSNGATTELPLVVFATAENKYKVNSSEIALGTTKEYANKLQTLTSRKQCINMYGNPFYAEENGTVKQDDERNEHGLFGLYDLLGVTNTAYALRADIDLGQLEPSFAEPVGSPVSNKLWLDTNATSLGLAVANGGLVASRAWTDVNDFVKIDSAFVKEEDGVITVDYPVESVGEFAVAVKDGKVMYFESFADATWKLVGSEDWVNGHGSYVVSGEYTSLPMAKQNCLINGKVITFEAEDILTLQTVAAKIEAVSGCKAVANGKKLTLSAETGTLHLVDRDADVLLKLGFPMVNKVLDGEQVKVFFNTSISYPSGSVSGSVWFKTTAVNNGMDYAVKKYNEVMARWNTLSAPVAGNFTDVEKQLKVSQLNSNSVSVVHTADEGLFGIYKFSGDTTTKITGIDTKASISAGSITLKQLSKDNSLKVGTFTTSEARAKETYAKEFTKRMLALGINGVSMTVDNNGMAVILSDMGTALTLEMDEAVSQGLGIQNGEYSHWELVSSLVASDFEPKQLPTEGTLWFNDDYVVDIMVTDGSKWVGYQHMYPNASILVQSNEPEGATDNTLWIDPSNSSYPMLKRFYNGEWEVVNLTDQTTPLGCVFAELRSNAGYSYPTSEHEAYSVELKDLMLSDYVDPDAVDPRSYPAGMICFNTRCSTNNVKKFENKFKKAVEEMGESYQVGDSMSFATPGTSLNPETTRWMNASGNDFDGVGLFGRKAQRKLVVNALAETIKSNEEIRNENYDFMYVICPGYPELDDEINSLNVDKKEIFYHVSDCPNHLKPNATDIQKWANNEGNASSHGEDGRVIRSEFQSRNYPPMGLTTNVDGAEIAIPTSITKIRTLLALPRGEVAAGYNFGNISSLGSVGYINDEGEYNSVSISQSGLGPVLTSEDINPILARRNTGLMFWGENTEYNLDDSVMGDEHCVITLCRLKRQLDEACNPFFFRIINQGVIDDFSAAIEAVLNKFVGSGEIYDYAIDTGSSVNTPETIQAKELWANVAVSFSRSVEYIGIPIRGVNYGSL